MTIEEIQSRIGERRTCQSSAGEHYKMESYCWGIERDRVTVSAASTGGTYCRHFDLDEWERLPLAEKDAS